VYLLINSISRIIVAPIVALVYFLFNIGCHPKSFNSKASCFKNAICSENYSFQFLQNIYQENIKLFSERFGYENFYKKFKTLLTRHKYTFWITA